MLHLLYFFLLKTRYAYSQGVAVRPRPRPQPVRPPVPEGLETNTNTRQNTPLPKTPQRPTDLQRSQMRNFQSNGSPHLLPNQSPRISPNIFENLRRLGLQERYSYIEPSLNHTQRTRLERSISLLAEYSQSTPSINKQAELIEKLGQALLSSPTHGFIRHVIRTLTAGQITSPNKISSVITVLDEANSFTTRTFHHTNAIDRCSIQKWVFKKRWRMVYLIHSK